MFPKLALTLIFATLMGAVLLGMRQQRLETMHQMTRLHVQADRHRRDTWDLQIRIAQMAEPQTLQASLQRVAQDFEPATTQPDLTPTTETRMARTEEE